MQARAEAVRSYYEYVDEAAYDDLFALFSDDIVYERPGQDPIEGIEAFQQFYREGRPLSDGEHTVHDVVADGDTVAVRGEFSGRQGETRVSFGFTDFHVFDEDGNIAHRYTHTDRDTV